jgi:hypothetical protein
MVAGADCTDDADLLRSGATAAVLARIAIPEHALVQNLRRGHDELAVEEPVTRRVAVAFDELTLTI